MTTPEIMLAELRGVVEALGEYRSEVVLAGGFVPLVYRETPHDFRSPPYDALLSGDIDLTVPSKLAVKDRPLREYLDEADFVVVLSRSTKPPIHYFQRSKHGNASPGPYHVEFLAPLKGAPNKTDGTPKSPSPVQRGINAQLLRHMDLLLHNPLPVTPFGADLEFRVPTPASYVVQKLLASQRRDSTDKRDKDLAYIYDVAVLTRDVWHVVADQVRDVRGSFPRPFAEASTLSRDLFADSDAAGPRAVARIMRDHNPAHAPTERGAHVLLSRFFEAITIWS